MSETETGNATAMGFAPCEKPASYIASLVKELSKKLPATYDEGAELGAIPFSNLESAVLQAQPNGISIMLVTAAQDRNIQLRNIIEEHLNRFAHREGALNYDWKEQ